MRWVIGLLKKLRRGIEAGHLGSSRKLGPQQPVGLHGPQ